MNEIKTARVDFFYKYAWPAISSSIKRKYSFNVSGKKIQTR